MLKFLSAVSPTFAPVARRVILLLIDHAPLSVAQFTVPDIVPFDARLRPAGIVPLTKLMLTPCGSDATNCWLDADMVFNENVVPAPVDQTGIGSTVPALASVKLEPGPFDTMISNAALATKLTPAAFVVNVNWVAFTNVVDMVLGVPLVAAPETDTVEPGTNLLPFTVIVVVVVWLMIPEIPEITGGGNPPNFPLIIAPVTVPLNGILKSLCEW
jgi:hypothetical protein